MATATPTAQPHRLLEFEIRGLQRELPAVRERAAQALTQHLGDTHSAVGDAVLVLCELVTNAIRHTRSGDGGYVHIELLQTASGVRIVVIDDGGTDTVPYVRPLDLEQAETGRGMRVVDAFTTRWEVTGDTGGRTVTADIDLGDHPALPDAR